ncbi:MAG: sugar phosphate isomerase/epimerase [Candidatus Latescibacterota bacterium]|nr:sugar phosphate isomerase/epimerase [Candidatus Latescibacterota bacterium]
MARIPIALQLYSVREACAGDFEGTVKAVAEMGYEGVEFAGYYDRSAQEIRDLCDDLGLKVAGTHIRIDTLLGNGLAATVEFNNTLGNCYLIVPGLAEEYRESADAWRRTAGVFNEISRRLDAENMRTGYHNHTMEFEELDGQIPWDLFCEGTAERVVTQLDIGHCLRAGGDPVAALNKYPRRAQLVHVKEYAAVDEAALVGEGDVDWSVMFEACETVGDTRWYIVEQERYPVSPMESVERCLANLRKLGK